MDETRIDAAPTPAHIFAYRAFRSVFVGSPESSPVRAPFVGAQNLNDNKENALRPSVRGSRFVTSPVKSKRNAENASDYPNLSLTPKKQRINAVSPTKSILKNPNITTPRRAELRDVTVTFKDVRASVSPEMARRGSPTRVCSQPNLRSTLAALSTVTASAPALRIVSASQVEGLNKGEKNHVVTQFTGNGELDGYMAQTEKEIRRLIKYGQKWREYARRQENENVKLKALIEDLQKENGRLSRKDDAEPEIVKSSSSTNAPAASLRGIGDTKLPKQRNQSLDLENKFHNKKPEKWKIPLNSFDDEKQRSSSTILEKKTEQAYYEDALHTSRNIHKAVIRTSSVPDSGKNTAKNPPIHKSQEHNPPQHTKDDPSTKAEPPSKPTLHHKLSPDPDLHQSNPPTESSSEDSRKAAARERLRLKREAKVASVRASSAPIGRIGGQGSGSGSGRDPERLDIEESQVDWMAIA